jgi:hypothetical protein
MAKPVELGGIKYDRDFWPLTDLPEPRTVGELLQVVQEAGVLNCQVLLHLVYECYWQILLPHHFRSEELFEDTENSIFLDAKVQDSGRVSIHETLKPGDIFFFCDLRKKETRDCSDPKNYHIAVVWKFARDGEPLLLHAVSFADGRDAAVLCRLSRFEALDHRVCMGIKRLTQESQQQWRIAGEGELHFAMTGHLQS